MSDERTQPGLPDNHEQLSQTQERTKMLVRQVNNLIELLRSQRNMLKQKGVNLPPGALDNLRTLKRQVDMLSKKLMRSQVELKQLRALADTTALINSTLETDAVLNQVMDTVIDLSGAERGYIVLKDRETGQFDQFRVARGLDTAQLSDTDNDADGESASEKKSGVIISKSIVNKVAQSGEAVLTDNASQDAQWKDQQSIVGFALRSILAVPLKLREEVIGVVYCDNRILSGLFQVNDRDMLAAFANQAGVAIENARLFDEVRQQIDQMTDMRELLDNVFDSIANGVITVNMGYVVTTCNAAANDILGSNDDVIGKPLKEILPDLGQEFDEAIKDVRLNGGERTVDAGPVLNGRGERSWTVIISPLRDAVTGNIQGLALVIDDLTEQLKHEAQLAELSRYLPSALVDNFRSIEDVNVAGQERQITVIATDVRGFTSFSERLQPEELMMVINKYLSLATDAINLYEGVVDKYMGDAVTGLYNTQLNPQEDHAVRAVRSAMSIIYDLYALHEVLPEDQCLFYGIGIHTGTAFLGNVGSHDRQEFAALGEAADIAKILEGNAKGGEVIISEATYEIIKDLFDCESRVPEKTKDYDIPKVYKILKRKKGTRTSPLLLDPELASLLDDLDD
jgi:adenylate cyclase